MCVCNVHIYIYVQLISAIGISVKQTKKVAIITIIQTLCNWAVISNRYTGYRQAQFQEKLHIYSSHISFMICLYSCTLVCLYYLAGHRAGLTVWAKMGMENYYQNPLEDVGRF